MFTGINVCLFQSIGYVYTGLMQAVGASNKVFEFIDRKPDIPNSGKLSPAKLEGRLDFKDVTFAYPTRPEMDVLKVRMLLDFEVKSHPYTNFICIVPYYVKKGTLHFSHVL